MKLAAHYNKASIIISVSVLIISGLIYYLAINHIARQQLDDNLSEELGEFVDYVNTNHALPKTPYDENQTSYSKTPLKKFDTKFFDAPYTNIKEKEVEKGRGIAALIKVNGTNYIVTIIESSENTEYLVQIISVITLILSAILLVVLILTNRFVLKGLWRPFYNILDQVKWFNLADSNKIIAINSTVDEFSELNDAVSKMSLKASSDYQGLKTFTENASHEMMTPLAIITSKLDILIQDENIRADQFSEISDIYAATSKLSRLNQSLLLLVKIDNDLLADVEVINIQTVIIEKTKQFQEIIRNKEITIDLKPDNVEIEASKYLIDVLINNLFSNAIRHNKVGGIIKIELSRKMLLFQNSGGFEALDNQLIFERFYKGKTSDGTGLGLAIIKNICHKYNFALSYFYLNDLHSFQIDFGGNI
jgi:signal transduction histidine kinase